MQTNKLKLKKKTNEVERTMAENAKKKQCVRDESDVELTETITDTSVGSGEDLDESIADATEQKKWDLKKHIIANAAKMLMHSSSSSESDDEEEFILKELLRRDMDIFSDAIAFHLKRNQRSSVKPDIDQLVPSYSEEEFRNHFRISRKLFVELCGRLSNWDKYKELRPDKRLLENTHIMVFLWFAGHEPGSFRDISERFDICLSSVGTIIERVSLFLSSLSSDIIKWPNEEKKCDSSIFFATECLFPQAIGCIGGMHVDIDPPSASKDGKNVCKTVFIQGICDENKKFINVYIEYPGSSHESLVLKNSPIYEKLPTVCRDYYLLGDSAYSCNKYFMTPYKDNGHLTRAQKLFNIKLSKGHECIEHTFSILKQRFKQLHYCKLRGIEKICNFIRACCVLHNMASETDLIFTSAGCEENTEYDLVSQGNSLRDAISHTIENHMADQE